MTSTLPQSETAPSVYIDCPIADIEVISKLQSGKFSVYLVSNGDQKEPKLFAMKIMPFKKGIPNPLYFNEIKYANLSHPNIITPSFYEVESELSGPKKTSRSSLILSEYAPNQDFFQAVVGRNIDFDDKLTRTYFQQLISGIEFLHKNKIAHLDLKLENLVLDKDFRLRIIDFDLAKEQSNFDKEMFVGSINYRAPEIISSKCQNGFAADIYSAGIILFILLSGGVQPYCEGEKFKGVDLYNCFMNDHEKFWNFHESISGPNFWDSDIRNLIEAMCSFDDKKRATIESIKAHSWFNGEIYTEVELKNLMSKHFSKRT